MNSDILNKIEKAKQELNQIVIDNQDKLLVYQENDYNSQVKVFDLETKEQIDFPRINYFKKIQNERIFTILELKQFLNKLKKYNINFEFVEKYFHDDITFNSWLELRVFLDSEIVYYFYIEDYEKLGLYNTIDYIFDNYKLGVK